LELSNSLDQSIYSALNFLLILIAEVVLDFRKVKVFACATSENVQHVQASGLKVGRGVVRLGYENAVVDAVIGWLVVVLHPDEPAEIIIFYYIMFLKIGI